MKITRRMILGADEQSTEQEITFEAGEGEVSEFALDKIAAQLKKDQYASDRALLLKKDGQPHTLESFRCSANGEYYELRFNGIATVTVSQ